LSSLNERRGTIEVGIRGSVNGLDVFDGFGGGITVATQTQEVLYFIKKNAEANSALLMMSSGNFDGIDYDKLGSQLLESIK
jgi:hypothetical protein